MSTSSKVSDSPGQSNIWSSADLSGSDIRLVTVFPGQEDDPIQCCLQRVTLDSHPKYEALSYAWGNSNDVVPLKISGQELSVTRNLAVALRHIRQKEQSRTLWIDALCINQSDVLERNHQVQRMAAIYREASRVLCWLGEGSGPCDSAMDWIARVTERLSLPMEETEGGMVDWIKDAPSHLEREGLIKIAARPWFQRVWTLQEFVVNKNDPLIGCGWKWLPWSHIFQTLMDAPRSHPNSGTYLIITRELIRRHFHWPNVDLPLTMLLFSTYNYRATDPRDRVFALLGMSKPAVLDKLAPDYRNTVQQVFMEITMNIIERDQSLHILSFWSAKQIPNLPSWVPDFSTASGFINPLMKPLKRKWFSVSFNKTLRARMSSRTKSLILTGVQVDMVHIKDGPIRSTKCGDMLSLIQRLRALLETRMIAELPAEDVRCGVDRVQPIHNILVAEKFSFDPEVPVTTAERKAIFDDFEGFLMGHRPGHETNPQVTDYKDRCEQVLEERCFFGTNAGFCGIGPAGMEQGDVVAIFYGTDVPFILRPHDDHFKLIGECYVAGIMHGELIEMNERDKEKPGRLQEQDFIIK